MNIHYIIIQSTAIIYKYTNENFDDIRHFYLHNDCLTISRLWIKLQYIPRNVYKNTAYLYLFNNL